MRDRVLAYLARMTQHQYFSHVTAAQLYGVPLPLHLQNDARLHVSARAPGNRPRAAGIVGHAVDDPVPAIVYRGRIPLSSPADAWCELALILGLDDLVVAGDFLVSGDEAFSGRPALTTIDELRAAVVRRLGHRGSRRLAAALELVRRGSLSPMETLTRLVIVRNGLPEPELNLRIFDDDGSFLAMVDLAFPAYKVIVEYEGDHHRDPVQFRRDLRRRERLEDVGWTVIRITADDLADGAAEFLARLRLRLAARGARL